MGRIDYDKGAYYGSDELYSKWMVQGECEPGDVLLTMEAPLGNVTQVPDSKKYILSFSGCCSSSQRHGCFVISLPTI